MGIPWKKRYIKMKIVLLFFFLMSGVLSMFKRSDVYIEDEKIVGKFRRLLEEYGSQDKDCKCKSDTDEAGGNCQTKYKGIRWCYLEEDKHAGCADFSGDPGSYWSWSACYPYKAISNYYDYDYVDDCITTESLYHDDNRLVLRNTTVCSVVYNYYSVVDGDYLTELTGTVGTSYLNQGTKECKCSSFSRGLNGNCQSKYERYYWCYLEPNKHEGCADFHFLPSKRGGGRYWSWSACYNDDSKPF